MNTNDFVKLNSEEKNETYGGWAWLIALVPLMIQAIVTTVAAIKTLVSHGDGSIKTSATGAVEAHWSDKSGKAKKGSAKAAPKSVVYYAY
ncbi:MAG: hypothetical protein KAG04_01600 [Mycoplasmataceae bacterium]|nr:hypothetical protein [Mycoplasmataceae bacterium]